MHYLFFLIEGHLDVDVSRVLYGRAFINNNITQLHKPMMSQFDDLRRVALRSAPVTCATAVAHSLMQRLRQRARSKFSRITKKRRTRGLSHVI